MKLLCIGGPCAGQLVEVDEKPDEPGKPGVEFKLLAVKVPLEVARSAPGAALANGNLANPKQQHPGLTVPPLARYEVIEFGLGDPKIKAWTRFALRFAEHVDPGMQLSEVLVRLFIMGKVDIHDDEATG